MSDKANVYTTIGEYQVEGKIIRITELPIETWTDNYKLNLERMNIDSGPFFEKILVHGDDRVLNSRGHHDDMLQTAEQVHQSSTDAASSCLVTALNNGRDVIMDGTLSWEPFVEQMITMARNVHKQRYIMGVGYKVAEDRTTTEEYWRKEET
ncbi:hypothetical protein Rs2_35872 [Raphanus sativus]|nr:hypothetical protein Rs2_35872 [Raphanus sativus]